MSVQQDDRVAEPATALGWFSLALGAAQLAAPDAVSRLIGVKPTEGSRNLMRAIGAREVTAAMGILRSDDPSGFLWARVAGDAMDLGLLATALNAASQRARPGLATVAVAGVTALDVMAATDRSGRR